MAQRISEAVLVIDDRHPAITYSGTWVQDGAPGREYLNTTTWTTSPGASATVDFYGNSITVIGTLSLAVANSTSAMLDISFTVDNSPTAAMVHLPQTSPPTYAVPLWASPVLGPTLSTHKLLITHDTVPGSGSYLVLDGFLVGGHNVSGPNPISSSSSATGDSRTTQALSIVFGVALCMCLVLCIFLFLQMKRYKQLWRRASEPHGAMSATAVSGSLRTGQSPVGFGRDPHQDGKELVDGLRPGLDCTTQTHTRAPEPKPPDRDSDMYNRQMGQDVRVYNGGGGGGGGGGLPGVGVHPPV